VIAQQNMPAESVTLLNWNVEFAKPGTPRSKQVSAITQDHNPTIACITEGYENLFDTGHTICSQPDYAFGGSVD
jgi:hypothetical protein